MFGEIRCYFCYVTTNLGVGSSNLSGRANFFNTLANRCRTK